MDGRRPAPHVTYRAMSAISGYPLPELDARCARGRRAADSLAWHAVPIEGQNYYLVAVLIGNQRPPPIG